MQSKQINSIKAVLAERNKIGKWLAYSLGKNISTVSRWCTNEVQPSIETLREIAIILQVDVKDLLCSTKINSNYGTEKI